MNTSRWWAAWVLGSLVGSGQIAGPAVAAEPQVVVPDEGSVLTRGPIHEAFAQQTDDVLKAGATAPKQPPDPIEEVPPDAKPEGESVEWIPGYWHWDEERNDFIWISGIWRVRPAGMSWVPGYWTQVDGQYRRVPGAWVNGEVGELKYQPAPPESLEVGPSSDPPSGDCFWVPGCWVYQVDRYCWRPGYWIPYVENRVWVPSYYSWSPGGYMFIDGYWDYPFTSRGTLFCPVYFEPYVYTQPNFCYRPYFALNAADVFVHLFIRPGYYDYYFGDYYGYGGGPYHYYPWFDYGRCGRRYDPFYTHFAYHDFHRGHHGVNYYRGLHDYYSHHADHRPRHNFADQHRYFDGHHDRGRYQGRGGEGEHVFLAQRLDEFKSRTDLPQRWESLGQDRRHEWDRRIADYRQLARDRLNVEKVALTDSRSGRDGHSGDSPRERSLRLPDSLRRFDHATSVGNLERRNGHDGRHADASPGNSPSDGRTRNGGPLGESNREGRGEQLSDALRRPRTEGIQERGKKQDQVRRGEGPSATTSADTNSPLGSPDRGVGTRSSRDTDSSNAAGSLDALRRSRMERLGNNADGTRPSGSSLGERNPRGTSVPGSRSLGADSGRSPEASRNNVEDLSNVLRRSLSNNRGETRGNTDRVEPAESPLSRRNSSNSPAVVEPGRLNAGSRSIERSLGERPGAPGASSDRSRDVRALRPTLPDLTPSQRSVDGARDAARESRPTTMPDASERLLRPRTESGPRNPSGDGPTVTLPRSTPEPSVSRPDRSTIRSPERSTISPGVPDIGSRWRDSLSRSPNLSPADPSSLGRSSSSRSSRSDLSRPESNRPSQPVTSPRSESPAMPRLESRRDFSGFSPRMREGVERSPSARLQGLPSLGRSLAGESSRSMGSESRSLRFSAPSRSESFSAPRSFGSRSGDGGRAFSLPRGDSGSAGRSFSLPRGDSGSAGRSFSLPRGNSGSPGRSSFGDRSSGGGSPGSPSMSRGSFGGGRRGRD